MTALDATGRHIVELVQELQDERDELLNILGRIADGHRASNAGTAVVTVPVDVMAEIRRRVSHAN